MSEPGHIIIHSTGGPANVLEGLVTVKNLDGTVILDDKRIHVHVVPDEAAGRRRGAQLAASASGPLYSTEDGGWLVLKAGDIHHVGGTMFKVLRYLEARSDATKDDVIREVWGGAAENTLWALLKRLRDKLRQLNAPFTVRVEKGMVKVKARTRRP